VDASREGREIVGAGDGGVEQTDVPGMEVTVSLADVPALRARLEQRCVAADEPRPEIGEHLVVLGGQQAPDERRDARRLLLPSAPERLEVRVRRDLRAGRGAPVKAGD